MSPGPDDGPSTTAASAFGLEIRGVQAPVLAQLVEDSESVPPPLGSADKAFVKKN